MEHSALADPGCVTAVDIVIFATMGKLLACPWCFKGQQSLCMLCSMRARGKSKTTRLQVHTQT